MHFHKIRDITSKKSPCGGALFVSDFSAGAVNSKKNGGVAKLDVFAALPFQLKINQLARLCICVSNSCGERCTPPRGGRGGFSSPAVAPCGANQIPLPSQKAAKGEDLRRMSRTTTAHAYHLPVQNPACAGAWGAGGGVSTPAKKADTFCNTLFYKNKFLSFLHFADNEHKRGDDGEPYGGKKHQRAGNYHKFSAESDEKRRRIEPK